MTNFKDRYVAGEIFTSGTCNLNCEYCYLPKTKSMKDIHSDIIKKVKSNDYIEYLRYTFGNNLEYLSLWGAEPSLTIDKMTSTLEEAVVEFPRLRDIKFSSNFIMTTKLKKFLSEVRFARRVTLEIQISLDGPEFITDSNRGKGTTKKIVNNIKDFSEFIDTMPNGNNVNLVLKFKPTIDAENLALMKDRYDLIDEYFSFFKNIYKMLKGNYRDSHFITLAIPGEYTSVDGANFAELIRNSAPISKKYFTGRNGNPIACTAYSHRYGRVAELMEEFFDKPGTFTCSGGRSQLQVGKEGEMHICHRTLFLNYKEYRDGMKSSVNLDNRDVELMENGQIDNLRKNYIVTKGDELGESRFYYVQGMFHNHWKFKFSLLTALIMEMAYAGHIFDKFKDKNNAEMLSMFITSVTSCHVENLINTSSVFIPKMSLINIFGNGAFEEIIMAYNRMVK